MFFIPYNLFGQTIDTLAIYTYKLKGKTSTGRKTIEIKEPFLAISRDMLVKYPFHTKVILYGCTWEGEYLVMDVMGPIHKKSADIYYTGIRRNVTTCLCTFADK